MRGRVMWEDISMEKLLMGEVHFNEGAQDFLALFEKTIKNEYEKFFVLKVRNSIKT